MAEPAPVGVELVPRDAAGANPAGHGAQLALADEGADVVLGALELFGQLSNGQWGWALDGSKYREAGGSSKPSARSIAE